MTVSCPTRTPPISVMAFSGPVGRLPIDSPRSRNRARFISRLPFDKSPVMSQLRGAVKGDSEQSLERGRSMVSAVEAKDKFVDIDIHPHEPRRPDPPRFANAQALKEAGRDRKSTRLNSSHGY